VTVRQGLSFQSTLENAARSFQSPHGATVQARDLINKNIITCVFFFCSRGVVRDPTCPKRKELRMIAWVVQQKKKGRAKRPVLELRFASGLLSSRQVNPDPQVLISSR
jgi:hypothetical protein